MAIPDYQSLMLPVLRAAAKGEVRLGYVVEQLADELHLSEDERTELLPSGTQTLANRVGWAKTYLAKAGLIASNRRAHYSLTERGREVLASNPARIDNNLLMKFEEFRQFRDRSASKLPAQSVPLAMLPPAEVKETPDEIIREAHKQLETALAEELIDRVRQMSPAFFERLVIRLLLSMGYGGSVEEAGRALGRSGDDGVDGVVDQDALGLDRVYVQAKRYSDSHSIGAGAVRDFFGSLDRHKAAKGLLVTTSSFSSSAKETAEFLSKRIVLIDGVQLAKLMIRYDVGCKVEEAIYLKKVDEDFFG
ncbi:restriction endonuclease [Alloacidobacterium sp.]|uniref:restriction endonuclease n=1 Tax=Alloacidobacterium sp. TaxID=2951999 RepID=UPI002D71A26D|nr:restriction endonuclease [Alloacidobacterium sp.]HYK35623.1 restriction endonuclease [Alloacidobacterium sp.]